MKRSDAHGTLSDADNPLAKRDVLAPRPAELRHDRLRRLNSLALNFVDHPAQQRLVGDDRRAPLDLVLGGRSLAVGEPVNGGEVDRLRAIQSVVKAGVVGKWEGDDELVFVLRCTVHRDPVLRQEVRGENRYELVEQERLALKQIRHELHRRFLKEGGARGGHPKPRFRLSVVQKVDRVHIVVFGMPCERGEEHAVVPVDPEGEQNNCRKRIDTRESNRDRGEREEGRRGRGRVRVESDWGQSTDSVKTSLEGGQLKTKLSVSQVSQTASAVEIKSAGRGTHIHGVLKPTMSCAT